MFVQIGGRLRLVFRATMWIFIEKFVCFKDENGKMIFPLQKYCKTDDSDSVKEIVAERNFHDMYSEMYYIRWSAGCSHIDTYSDSLKPMFPAKRSLKRQRNDFIVYI